MRFRWVSELGLLPRLSGLASPLRRVWEWAVCRLVRCGWWCSHAIRPSRIVARLTVAAVLLVSSALVVLT